jgi:hypothetical protein
VVGELLGESVVRGEEVVEGLASVAVGCDDGSADDAVAVGDASVGAAVSRGVPESEGDAEALVVAVPLGDGDALSSVEADGAADGSAANTVTGANR